MKKGLILFVAFLLVVGFSTQAQAADLGTQLKGRILLQVEEHGEAWYINPENSERYFLGRPADAFNLMRELGLGVSEANYNKFNGYAPSNLAGKILLRVESHGEAYYINPVDRKMHYLGRPADAFAVMRNLGLGITNENLNKIQQKVQTQTQTQTQSNSKTGLNAFLGAIDTCKLAKVEAESTSIIDGITLTTSIENEIKGDAGDNKCKYYVKYNTVTASVTGAQKSAIMAKGYSDAQVDQMVADTQVYYKEIWEGQELKYEMEKDDLKSVIQSWINTGKWEITLEMMKKYNYFNFDFSW